MSLKPLQGRSALITGATRAIGIGAAISRRLAEDGADVFVHYFRPFDRTQAYGVGNDEPQALIESLRQLGVRAHGYEADLSDPKAPGDLMHRAVESLGGIDILVNNAAYWFGDQIDTVTAESIDRHMAVNVRAAMLLCRAFVEQRGDKTGGRIINLTSGQGTGPMPDEVSYAVSKGAIGTMTFCLAQSLKKRGLTINAVNPGATDTGWVNDAIRVELKRVGSEIGTPQQVADTVAFLTSDAASRITGQIITASGGPQ